jgi:hypothetical protein
MTTKLQVYNKALAFIGERKLASLDEAREPRRVLDDWYDVRSFLEAGLWRFARRTVRLEYSPSVEPDFGYRRAFDQPSDFVRTAMVCIDEYFKMPLEEYSVEAGYWFADQDVIYVSYISDDPAYGADLSLWTQAFEEWVGAWLASKICLRITGDENKTKSVIIQEERLLKSARARDSMEEPTKMPPHGTWVGARSGRFGRRDGGNRNRLTG